MKRNVVIYCALGLLVCGIGLYFVLKNNGGKEYKFDEYALLSQVAEINISDESVIKVKEDKGTNSGYTGGYTLQYTVKGLKAGKSDVTVKIVNGDTKEEVSSSTYHFEVDNDLNVKLLSKE